MQSEDLAIPEVKLIQNVGGAEAKSYGAVPGDFYFSLTQETIKGSEGFEIVVLKPAWKTRTYWGRTEIDDDPPMCSSLDAVTSVNGDVCATECPHNAFTDAPYLVDATERRSKCNPNYELLAVNTADMMPILIRCSGISAQAAKELNSLLLFHRSIKGHTHKAKIRVTAVPKKTSVGEAFAIKFGAPQIIEEEALAIELADLRTMLQITTPVEEKKQIEQGLEKPAEEKPAEEKKPEAKTTETKAVTPDF